LQKLGTSATTEGIWCAPQQRHALIMARLATSCQVCLWPLSSAGIVVLTRREGPNCA